MVILFSMFLFGLLGGVIGGTKGEAFMGFLAGFFLGPIGALLVLFSKGNTGECPYCKKRIPNMAELCSHCRSSVAWEKGKAIKAA